MFAVLANCQLSIAHCLPSHVSPLTTINYLSKRYRSLMSNNVIDSNLLRQIFFISLIVLLGIVLFVELEFFLPAFLGAITFYVLMRQRMFYLTEKRNWKKGRVALVLMLLSFLIILLPIGVLANMLASKISY